MPAPLVCEECGRTADAATGGWRGYLIERDDAELGWLFFCPRCVEREFEPWSDGRALPQSET